MQQIERLKIKSRKRSYLQSVDSVQYVGLPRDVNVCTIHENHQHMYQNTKGRTPKLVTNFCPRDLRSAAAGVPVDHISIQIHQRYIRTPPTPQRRAAPTLLPARNDPTECRVECRSSRKEWDWRRVTLRAAARIGGWLRWGIQRQGSTTMRETIRKRCCANSGLLSSARPKAFP